MMSGTPQPEATRLHAFVAESNRIEGITREPSRAEVDALRKFADCPIVTVGTLVDLVRVFQPDARLRDRPGLNVYVGDHTPPPGGPEIVAALEALLDDCELYRLTPCEAHVRYETLHPFTDGNGRSGRALWLWQHRHGGTDRIVLQRGFLHSFYYEALSTRRRSGV